MTTTIRSIIYAEHCSHPQPASEIQGEHWTALAEQVGAALREAFPEASVDVEIVFHTSGYGDGTTYRVDGERDDGLSEHCESIVEKTWMKWSEAL
jgi:hypothetical protein